MWSTFQAPKAGPSPTPSLPRRATRPRLQPARFRADRERFRSRGAGDIGSAPPACKRRPGLDHSPSGSRRARVKALSSPGAGPDCAPEPALECPQAASVSSTQPPPNLLYAALSFPSPPFLCRVDHSGTERGWGGVSRKKGSEMWKKRTSTQWT